ncbi:MAG: CDP-6-deoxy-delta-3,4-glucoseen reductase [Chromatiales bacterium]|nr:CDP-6-deoxy-delta-3,4-glucoseen reductase [Chromatiales bacterium]
MSFTVQVKPSGHQFTSEEGESILDAAERQGIQLPYGCRNGMCGSCSGVLVSGSVIYPDDIDTAELDSREQGYCLTCKAVATSDIVVNVHEVTTEEEVEVRSVLSRVDEIEQLAHDVMRVYLKLPEDQRLQFLAGQYIDFIMEDGRRRAFSIANASHDDERIELHIRYVSGGEFTEYVFDGMKIGDVHNIQGPLGGFYLREESDRPLVFMAGGTGFAPLKGIIEHALHIGINRPIHLYWGVRAKRDLYLGELAEQWATESSNITFTPVLSEPDGEWDGATGWVHEQVLADHPDMSGFDLYMSGPPVMIFAARDAFKEAGLSEDNMYSDVFEWAKDNPNK